MDSTLCRPLRSRFLQSLAWIALLSMAAVPLLTAAPRANPVSQLAADANRAFGLTHSAVMRLSVGAKPGEEFSVTVPLNGGTAVVDLIPQPIRSEQFQLLAQNAAGELTPIEPGPITTYRGIVRGRSGASAAASLLSDGIHLRVVDGEHETWMEPLAGRVPGAARGHHVVYNGAHVVPDGRGCLALAAAEIAGAAAGGQSGDGEPSPVAAGALKIAELACDADVEYFLDYGSVSEAQARIESVINSVNIQYERDVGISHLITTILVRTSESDPYSSTDAETLLNQFRNHWSANHGNISRDVAQLFTGKEIDSSTIGIAWLNAVCTSYGYGMVQSDFNNNFSCATDLSAHELGHNWGAGHCSCTSYTMNPSITCANAFNPVGTIPDIIAFRDSRTCLDDAAVDPPVAPSGLTAVTASFAQINLAWVDQANNEAGFDVERSTVQSPWTLAASLGAGATSYSDIGLAAGTLYEYRVSAFNSAGSSGYATVSATTEDAPDFIDQCAVGEFFGSGSISGSYLDSCADDAMVEAITEVVSNGKPSRRHSTLEHIWEFNVQAGSAVTVLAHAYGGSASDNFIFEASTDSGITYSSLFTAPVADDGQLLSAQLPPTASGSVLIRVIDSDGSAGELGLDTVEVDLLLIRTYLAAGAPPAAPSGLIADPVSAGQVTLTWADESDNEFGFEIERSVNGGTTWELLDIAGPDSSSYDDFDVAALTTYTYRIWAYNSAGDSAFDGPVSATTPDGPAGISLDSAVGYKVKGVHYADLTWSGAQGETVLIVRDGDDPAEISVLNTGAHTDNIGNKGAGSYTYRVCEPDASGCSTVLPVAF